MGTASSHWNSLARERHAELDGDRLIVSTRVGRLDAYASAADGRPATVVSLAFEPPLRAEIAIAEMTEEDLWGLWEHPEITFEDEVFDDALLVRGAPHFVRAVLDDEARAALLELRRACDRLRIDQQRITAMVLGPPLAAAALGTLLDLVEGAARRLVPERQGVERAYR